jgi:PAS domain S-box-containing protein
MFTTTSANLVLLTLVLTLGTFLLDSLLPVGVAGGVPYVVVVLISLWSPDRRYTITVAACCTLLVMVGHFYSEGVVDAHVAFLDRFLAIVAIWAAALLSLRRKTIEDQLRHSEARYASIVAYAGLGIVMIDGNGRIDSINPAAATIFGIPPTEFVGKNFVELVAPRYRTELKDYLITYLNTKERAIIQRDIEVQGVRKGQITFPMEISVGEVPVPKQSLFVVVVRDITERSHTEQERVHLIGELKKAIADVKTLGGLIPICASCKKIRDDQGYWEQIEVYIRDHSDAQFSHSLCPECVKSLYPELEDENETAPDKEQRVS